MQKINKILSYIGIATAGFSAFKLFQIFNKEESKSNFIGSKDKKIVFTLKNNSDTVQTEYLFDSRSGQDNSNVSVKGNLGMFNRELSNNPKIIKKIEFRNIDSNFSGAEGAKITPKPTSSEEPKPTEPIKTEASPKGFPRKPVLTSFEAPKTPAETTLSAPPPTPTEPTVNQATAPFKIKCSDASGNDSSKQYIPMVSSTQFQSGITSVDMDDLILDGECYMEYTMYPKGKVAIVVYYEDVPKKKLFKI